MRSINILTLKGRTFSKCYQDVEVGPQLGGRMFKCRKMRSVQTLKVENNRSEKRQQEIDIVDILQPRETVLSKVPHRRGWAF